MGAKLALLDEAFQEAVKRSPVAGKRVDVSVHQTPFTAPKRLVGSVRGHAKDAVFIGWAFDPSTVTLEFHFIFVIAIAVRVVMKRPAPSVALAWLTLIAAAANRR